MATATAEPRSLPATEGDGHKHKKNALSDGQGRLAWILLAPTLIVIAVVAGIPVVMSIREAFFQTNTGVDPTTGLIAGGETFVGLQNFTNIFAGQNPVPGNFGTMDRFWNAFLNTTFLTIVCVHPRDHSRCGDGPDHGEGLPRSWPRPGRHPGAVGDPDHRFGPDVEAHLRRVRRDEPDSRHARFSGWPIQVPRSGRSS